MDSEALSHHLSRMARLETQHIQQFRPVFLVLLISPQVQWVCTIAYDQVFGELFINLRNRFWLAEVAQYSQYSSDILCNREDTQVYYALSFNVYGGLKCYLRNKSLVLTRNFVSGPQYHALLTIL
jgi:hypothetical protein